MEIAQSPQYMDIVQFIIAYIRENRKFIPPADFLHDFPEQLDRNYTILLSSLEGENYGLWISEFYKEAESLGLEVTNELIVEALKLVRKEKDQIVSHARLFVDLLRWCDTWTNPSHNISDYDQKVSNFHIGYVIGQVLRIVELQQSSVLPSSATHKAEKKGFLENAASVASIASVVISLVFGLTTLLPDSQITEQNEILTGIWQEMQEYNDRVTPTPAPEATPTPTEPLLST